MSSQRLTEAPPRRWEITDSQRNILEDSYAANAFPDLASRKLLALDLNVTPRQVQVWFQNRRQKERAKESGGSPAVKKSAQREAAFSPSRSSPVDEPPSSPSSIPSPITEHELLRSEATSPTDRTGPRSIADVLRPATQAALSSFGDLLGRGALDRASGIGQAAAQLPMWPLKGAPQLGMHLFGTNGAAQPLTGTSAQDLSIERQITQQLRQLVRTARQPAGARPTIAKPADWRRRTCGVPMDRRSISMDALEVLSSGFGSK